MDRIEYKHLEVCECCVHFNDSNSKCEITQRNTGSFLRCDNFKRVKKEVETVILENN